MHLSQSEPFCQQFFSVCGRHLRLQSIAAQLPLAETSFLFVHVCTHVKLWVQDAAVGMPLNLPNFNLPPLFFLLSLGIGLG